MFDLVFNHYAQASGDVFAVRVIFLGEQRLHHLVLASEASRSAAGSYTDVQTFDNFACYCFV